MLDYGFDWSARGLLGDKIISTSCVVEAGDVAVTAHGLSVHPNITVTWLSGGTAGSTNRLGLRAVTEQGRTLDETLTILITPR